MKHGHRRPSGHEPREDPPPNGPERTRYFEDELPAYMRELVTDHLVQPAYDALVVDEAQDHDTAAADDNGSSVDWWPVYWALLRRGAGARVGIFYDAAQRPSFRKGAFDPAQLLATPQFNPVRVQLHGTVRYTRPILAYLKTLESTGTAHLVAGLHQIIPLPPGPDVLEECVQPGDEFATVDRLLRHWFGQGWCRPEQVAILSRRGPLERSALVGCTRIGGVPLHDGLVNPRGAVAFGSVNRAKGLDRLAVIILDFQPWDQLNSSDQVSLFMGASRARLLLAIVSTESPSPPRAGRSAIRCRK